MSIVAIVAALIMGIVLGLLGGGGSILAVPILVFLLGAFTGGALAAYIPGHVLLMLFGVLMLVTAIAMLRGKRGDDEERARVEDARDRLPIAKIAGEGFVVGGITGLVGAGGGFLVVPALVLLGGLPMRKAIGTSLMVIAMKSLAGFAGYAAHVTVDTSLVLGFVAAAVVGTVAGAQLGKRVEPDRLRSAFAYFVLAMGAFILAEKTGLIDLGKSVPEAHAAPSVSTEASCC